MILYLYQFFNWRLWREFKLLKPLISLLLLIVFISSIGSAFADNQTNQGGNGNPGGSQGDNGTVKLPINPLLLFSGSISEEFSQSTAHVGDTVTLTITASNDGLVDWDPVVVSAPIPAGLEFISFIVPDRTVQDYDTGSGIWNIIQMKSTERGHLKYIIITTKVLPSAEGQTLVAHANYNTLVLEPYGVHAENMVSGTSATLTVLGGNNGNGNGIGSGNGNGNGNGTGNGNGNGTGNGNALINNPGNSQLASAISNLTTSKNNPLLDSQTGGGGGNGKANIVSTVPPETKNVPPVSYIFVIIILVGLVIVGYIYGIRSK